MPGRLLPRRQRNSIQRQFHPVCAFAPIGMVRNYVITCCDAARTELRSIIIFIISKNNIHFIANPITKVVTDAADLI